MKASELIVETEVVPAPPKYEIAIRLEHKRGDVCLRRPDSVELLPSGAFLATREWTTPGPEPFNPDFYGQPRYRFENSAE